VTARVYAAADAALSEVPGHAFRILADAESTGGRYSLTEATSPPGASVPPHVHRAAVECFYILDGDYRLTVSGRVHETGPGGFHLVPRGAAHQFEVVGPRPARAVVIFSPAGFERVFRAMPDIFGTAGEPGPLWERANLDEDTILLRLGEPHPAGPDAVAVAASRPAHGTTELATPVHTHTGLGIRHLLLPRGREWPVGGEVCAVWVLSGALRVDTGGDGITARPGHLVTFAAGPARAWTLADATALLVLATSPTDFAEKSPCSPST
jgi:quercetin dioxygenase-like cupin family protein